ITSSSHNENEWSNESSAVFNVSGGNHYHWRFTQLSNDKAVSTDTVTNGAISTSITAEGNWYLHVLAHNESDIALGEATYGPVRFDNTAPAIDVIYGYESIAQETAITAGEWTDYDTPYFKWPKPESAAPIVGYAVKFATTGSVPLAVTQSTTVYKSPAVAEGGSRYFKVKAKDDAGNWSEVVDFEYKLRIPGPAPEISTMDINEGTRIEGGEVAGVSPDIILAVIFEDNMDEESVVGEVYLKAVRNREGQVISETIPANIIYIDSEKKVTVKPSQELDKNFTYRLIVSENARNATGNATGKNYIQQFRTEMDHTLRNVVVAADEKTKVEFEANAVTKDGYATVVDYTEDIPSGEPTDKFNYPIDGTAREFDLYDTSDNQFVENFSKPVVISIPYTDDDKDGIVDGSEPQVKVKTLNIYYLAPAGWEKVEGSVIDTKEQVVYAQVEHFSVYALMGASDYKIKDAYGYPVPWRPNDNNSNTGTVGQGIIFEKLPSECDIRIYTVTGKLVKEINHTDGTDSEIWQPVENESEQKVVSGVYVYYIENEKGHKSGKLIIIR
nr:Ig-like domain-containing protein [Elusimicrobiota bacterium]